MRGGDDDVGTVRVEEGDADALVDGQRLGVVEAAEVDQRGVQAPALQASASQASAPSPNEG